MKNSMKKALATSLVALQVISFSYGQSVVNAQTIADLSPAGVKTLSPEGAITPTGTWNLGTRAGDFVNVAGMRGIDAATNTLVQGDYERIKQAFLNMQLIAASEGASLQDATRLVVYVTDMFRYRPLINQVQEELWGAGPYPPRTIVEVDRLNQDDIVEVEGTFYAPQVEVEPVVEGNQEQTIEVKAEVTALEETTVATVFTKEAFNDKYNAFMRIESPVQFLKHINKHTKKEENKGAVVVEETTEVVTEEVAQVVADANVSPNGVITLFPEGAIKPTGTWNLGTRAGDVVFVAGMRGIDAATNTLVQGDYERIKQAFLNMQLIAESEGASLQDATRLVVYVTDMFRYRPLINQVQQELWGAGPYPPRTIVEVDRLNQDDIVEVEGTFYAPLNQVQEPSTGSFVSPNGVRTISPEGAITPTGTWNLATVADDHLYVAGMRGIDPATNTLVQGDYERIKQAFLNMKLIAESEGAVLQDATRIIVYVTDMYRYRPLVNQVQQELWGAGPYPPRTIIEIDRLNQDDIFEVEGTFYLGN